MHNHNFLKVNCLYCCNLKTIFNSFFSDFTNFKTKHAPIRHNLSFNPDLSISNNNLCIYYQNVRGFRTKLPLIHTNIVLLSYEVFILTDTWLTENFSNAELGLNDYSIFRFDRNSNTSDSRRGGGILIAVKNKLRPNLIVPPNTDVEQLFISVTLSLVSSLALLLTPIFLQFLIILNTEVMQGP
jgi:hypothetical protein